MWGCMGDLFVQGVYSSQKKTEELKKIDKKYAIY